MADNQAIPTPASTKKRVQWIDAAKGGCMLLVLLVHTNLAAIGTNSLPDKVLAWLPYFIDCYMPVFFVLSGYTFKDKAGILAHRARQLILPYAKWVAVYYGFFIIMAICRGEIYPGHWLKILAGCFYSRYGLFTDGSPHLFPTGAEPLWFLTALFVSYALYIPIHRAHPVAKHLLVAGYAGILLLLHQCPVLLPWSADTAFAGALFIYGGHALASSGLLQKLNIRSILLAAVLVPIYIWTVDSNGGSGGMYMRNFGRMGWYAPLPFILMGLSGTYLWCIFCQLLEKIRIVRPLSIIGEHSLTLLCSHMLVYLILQTIFLTILDHYPHLIDQFPYTSSVQFLSAVFCVLICARLRKAFFQTNRFF